MSCSSKYGKRVRRRPTKEEFAKEVCEINKVDCIHEVKNKKINDYNVLSI
jgi:hypothetical protein